MSSLLCELEVCFQSGFFASENQNIPFFISQFSIKKPRELKHIKSSIDFEENIYFFSIEGFQVIVKRLKSCNRRGCDSALTNYVKLDPKTIQNIFGVSSE